MLKKLAGETALYGLSSIVGRLLNYLLVPLYTRVLLPDAYGIIAELYALSALLMVLFTYRMETAFFRFGTEPAQLPRAFRTALTSLSISSGVLAGLLFLLAEPITVHLLHYAPDQAIYVRLFALILLFDVLAEIPYAKLRLQGRVWRFVSVRLTGIGVNIGSNLFFLLLCPWLLRNGSPGAQAWLEGWFNPDFLVGYVFLSNVLGSGIALLMLLPEVFGKTAPPPSPLDAASPADPPRFDPTLWRKMIIYAAPLILAGLAGIVNETIDRELLKIYLPGSIPERMAQIGIYAACYKLAMLMSLFTQAFRYAAEPFFFANARNEGAKQVYADVAKFFALAGCVAFLAVMLFIDVFRYFIDQAYWDGLSVVPILLMANLFLGLYYNLSIWYKLTDRTIYGGYIMGIGAIVTLVLNIVWIPKYGFLGSAWATFFCYLVVVLLSYALGRKHYPVPYEVVRIAAYVLLAVVLYFGCFLLIEQSSPPPALAYALRTFTLLFFLAIAYFGERRSLGKLV